MKYTIEQVMEALAKHEAIDGYDGVQECFLWSGPDRVR